MLTGGLTLIVRLFVPILRYTSSNFQCFIFQKSRVFITFYLNSPNSVVQLLEKILVERSEPLNHMLEYSASAFPSPFRLQI